MDFISAREWLDEAGEVEVQKLRLPGGMKPNKAEQVRRGIRGLIVQSQAKAPPPTLPPIKGPTLAEIEKKYGK